MAFKEQENVENGKIYVTKLSSPIRFFFSLCFFFLYVTLCPHYTEYFPRTICELLCLLWAQ